MKPLSFVSVPYTNSLVPTRCIGRIAPAATVRTEVPARLHALLLAGEADAALVPVVDLLFDDRLVLAGDFGIVADGPVESVLLKCRVPRQEVRTVAMDSASHTSNVLAELLFVACWRQTAAFGDDAAAADAAVAIGDRALTSGPGPVDVDLAEAWREATGLPFVFAAWTCRREHPRRAEMAAILDAALEVGMKEAPALAVEQARRLKMPEARCLRYMTDSIRYRIGSRERLAMETFRSMIVRHGHELASVRRTTVAQREVRLGEAEDRRQESEVRRQTSVS